MDSVVMDTGVFRNWKTVSVERRPVEDAAFHYLDYLYRNPRPLTPIDHEVLKLEIKCLQTKPHFAQSIAARATWIKDEYNKRHGYGLGTRQTMSILFKCSNYMKWQSIVERN